MKCVSLVVVVGPKKCLGHKLFTYLNERKRRRGRKMKWEKNVSRALKLHTYLVNQIISMPRIKRFHLFVVVLLLPLYFSSISLDLANRNYFLFRIWMWVLTLYDVHYFHFGLGGRRSGNTAYETEFENYIECGIPWWFGKESSYGKAARSGWDCR